MSRTTKISLSEPELIKTIRERQEKGAEALYDMYSAALYGVILRIIQNDEAAEDLLQECFLKIWNSISSYDETKGRLFTWMINIARNLAIDNVRSKSFRNELKTEDIQNIVLCIDEQQESKINPETFGLKDLVKTLKPEQKEILDRVYFQGYTHVEVAEELGLPLGTVKTRLRSAISTLRKLFN